MLPLILSVVILFAATACWYMWCKRNNRARAGEILGWIESTLGSHGDTDSVVWLGPSQFRIVLRMGSKTVFRRAAVLVELAPRELPNRWARSALRGEGETVTFEADFDVAPHFNLNLHNVKLFARTRRELKPTGNGWQFEQSTPLIMTTRNEWQREITGVISALLQLKEKDFLDLQFANKSPHYSVKLPLCAISPHSDTRLALATTIRELAVEASSYHGLSY